MDVMQIRKIKQAVEGDLLKIPGVTGVGIGYKRIAGRPTQELSIQVFVKWKHAVSATQTIPPEIQGVKTDVIEGNMKPNILKECPNQLQSTQDVTIYNPVIGGISIGPCRSVDGYVFAGTLGMIVTDNQSGEPLLLSNFHVMAINEEGAPGDDITQPSPVDGGHCPNHVIGQLIRSHIGDNVDCAVSSITGRDYSCQIAEIGGVTGITEAILGMPVRKRGRTTGLTYGSVDSIDLTVSVDYEDSLGTILFRDQIGITVETEYNTKYSLSGDSGAAVVDDLNRVIGLHFAGNEEGTYGIANPIQWVLETLDVSVCVTS